MAVHSALVSNKLLKSANGECGRLPRLPRAACCKIWCRNSISGTLRSPGRVGICLLFNVLFWFSGTVTEEVATAALQALGAVHACNLLHGDVEARNIMVVRGTQPSVLLVDFGFAQCSSNRNSQKAELRKLQGLVQDMMGVWMRKESGARYPHKRLCLV